MPQFFFAVGFALRLTFGRRMQTQGSAAAYWRMVRRLLGLMLVSLIVYKVEAPTFNWQQLKSLACGIRFETRSSMIGFRR